ncbi:hypothetical protein FOZ61_006771 [Perkinsus olseni]|uniref:Uncharacterized protein n=1 Tax=Perkinsus olseni TaxID=32597 RepID=A0A7J6M1Y5_PEROL|nr:hypothetical protein FOZ61_006771 [Perkinsus olseni]KAF4665593.1 hypothetical protein FOL46_003582 [Perkinsus olseni]
MARSVHPQQRDERAAAFFRALDQYNKSLGEDLDAAAERRAREAAVAKPGRGRPSGEDTSKRESQRSGGAPQRADGDGDNSDSKSRPQGGVEALGRATAERQKLVYEPEECKVTCLSLKQDITAERSRASALKKIIKNVRVELQKALDQRGLLLDRKHRITEECRDLERQVGEIVGRRGALLAELGRDREDVRLLKQALASAKAEKIELGRLVSAAKSEARRWANGIIHRAREAQSDSEVRLTDMAVGGLSARSGEEVEVGRGVSHPRREPPIGNAECLTRADERPETATLSGQSRRRRRKMNQGIAQRTGLKKGLVATQLSRWAEVDTIKEASSSSSSSCITIPMSEDVG